MSWLDPRWRYNPAATHGDSTAFRERQIARAIEAHAQRVERMVANVEPVVLTRADKTPRLVRK